MLAIDLPEDIEARLDALAKAEGRSKASYASEVLLEHLEDLENLRIAEERLADIKAGRTTTIPIADVMRKHGLAD